MTKRKIEYWVIPPEADAEFVAGMEDVLETYAKAYDPPRPVICMEPSLAADRGGRMQARRGRSQAAGPTDRGNSRADRRHARPSRAGRL